MRTPRSALSLLAAALLLAAPLSAQQVIDQNQTVDDVPFANLLSGWSGQSFVQSGGNISGVGIFLKSIYSYAVTGSVELRLFDRVPNGANSPVLLQSASQTVSLGAGAGGWFDFLFAPVALTPGSSLFLAVSGEPGVGYLQTHAAHPQPGDAYPGGQAYLAISLDPTAAYNANQGYDLTFRTYTTLQEPVLTPEPASAVLMASGLLGLAGFIRRAGRAQAERGPGA